MTENERADTLPNYEPHGTRFHDFASKRDMILVNDDEPRYAGWLLYRHPDGQWVTLREATSGDRAEIADAVERDRLGLPADPRAVWQWAARRWCS